jgi:hypothetical protein
MLISPLRYTQAPLWLLSTEYSILQFLHVSYALRFLLDGPSINVVSLLMGDRRSLFCQSLCSWDGSYDLV